MEGSAPPLGYCSDTIRKRRRVFPIREDYGDRRIHLHALRARGNQDLAELALVDGLDLHRGLVRLDFGDDIA